MSEPNTTRRWTIDRIAVSVIAVTMLPAGLQAAFAPKSFFDDFPLGRGWISRPPDVYNEHLVRDVGGLNLGLAAVLIIAIVTLSRPTIIAAAAASLLYGVPHLIYHIVNTDGLASGDVAASLGGLALFAVVPIALIVVSPKISVPAHD